jgi:hypothetical protein
MSFKYDLTASQQTPTSSSKTVLCKSFKIDVANGSGFTSGTTYILGFLPKEAQVIDSQLITVTAVSGGSVSAATLAVNIGGNSVNSGVNVFSTGTSGMNSPNYYSTSGGFQAATSDQTITYTPTLTGSGATAGVIYINLLYVV